jgi:Domain of unknown function (DUF4331)
MTKRRALRFLVAAGAVALALGVAWKTFAASRGEGPAVRTNPAADITDLYAWMTADKTKVNLVMNVFPIAPTGSKFSTQVLYVFHLASSAGFTMAATETKIICGFDANQTATCWVGNGEVVTGPVGVTAGVTSASGKTKLFAGLRDDPAFFNATGFTNLVAAVTPVLPMMPPDGTGCVTWTATAAQTLVRTLGQGANGGAAMNDFAGQNVLSIVLQVDTTLVTPGGKILGVWASTHQRG